MPENKTHSITETARLLGIGRSTLYVLIKDGRLPARKLGKRTLILHEDLERFIASLPTSSNPR